MTPRVTLLFFVCYFYDVSHFQLMVTLISIKWNNIIPFVVAKWGHLTITICPFVGNWGHPNIWIVRSCPGFESLTFFQSKMTHLYRDKDFLFLKWCQIIYLPVWRSIPTFHCTVSYYHISIYDTTRPSWKVNTIARQQKKRRINEWHICP